MFRILEALVRWLAPILSFTAEEIWQVMPKSTGTDTRGESVLFETWHDGLAATQATPGQRRWWSELLAVRAAVSKVLEGMRNDGAIGASLQAEVTLYADSTLRQRYQAAGEELRFFFITSELKLADLADKPDNAVRAEIEEGEVWIAAQASTAKKCVRCWHYRDDIGTHLNHAELCGRCVDNIDAAGETRQWF
jgi:isoleucyl-tRNA synthetase